MADLFSLFGDDILSDRDHAAGEPQSLSSISDDPEEQEYALKRGARLSEVEPLIDYSDFANFVFFNSALDYFNITGTKILNEYPYDGSRSNIEDFVKDLDGYQRFALETWPQAQGYLKFSPDVSSSYIEVIDNGWDRGVSRGGMLSPGTGSFAIEGWLAPGGESGSNSSAFGAPFGISFGGESTSVQVIAQKLSGNFGDGYTIYLSNSSMLCFRVQSGSFRDEVSAKIVDDVFFSCVLDKSSSGSFLAVYTGSLNQFPVLVQRVTGTVTGPIYLGTGSLFLGYGILSGTSVSYYSGSMDDIRVWNTDRQISDLTSSFNTKIYAQKGLLGLWDFNESGSVVNSPDNAIVIDRSGHRLNGRIKNYWFGVRNSGTLMLQDSGNPILTYAAPEIQQLVVKQQTSGSAYDRTNDNIVTRLFPEDIFVMEAERDSDVFANFLYVIARQFDELKLYIDQMSNFFKVNYGSFDQVPDALLDQFAKSVGWRFTGNFLSTNAFQYIFGKDVLLGLNSNAELGMKLFEIKNAFWRRVLNNLMYIYKNKGNRESVQALLRSYGVNSNFVRLKEYGYRPQSRIRTTRVTAKKSTPTLAFGSGTLTGSVTGQVTSYANTVECQVKFPTTASSNFGITASRLTGALWQLWAAPIGTGSVIQELSWQRDALSSASGTLIFSASNATSGSVNIAQGACSVRGPFFDGNWRNVTLVKDPVSGTFMLDVRYLDQYGNVQVVTGSGNSTDEAAGTSKSWVLTVGSYLRLSGAVRPDSQQWIRETRVWDKSFANTELNDHAFNFQSVGTIDPLNDLVGLRLHWRLDDDVTSSAAGQWTLTSSLNRGPNGTAANFAPQVNAYRRFEQAYQYVTSLDFGWNEEKIRIVSGSQVPLGDQFSDNPMVALEFNMVDALDEDIGKILATLDVMNEMIGQPANKYRGEYHKLADMRTIYFKRLQGRLNFRVFVDMLEFFDHSFVDMVRRLVPARALFLGDEFVVESHMLERPKHQWGYIRQSNKRNIISGSLAMYLR